MNFICLRVVAGTTHWPGGDRNTDVVSAIGIVLIALHLPTLKPAQRRLRRIREQAGRAWGGGRRAGSPRTIEVAGCFSIPSCSSQTRLVSRNHPNHYAWVGAGPYFGFDRLTATSRFSFAPQSVPPATQPIDSLRLAGARQISLVELVLEHVSARQALVDPTFRQLIEFGEHSFEQHECAAARAAPRIFNGDHVPSPCDDCIEQKWSRAIKLSALGKRVRAIKLS